MLARHLRYIICHRSSQLGLYLRLICLAAFLHERVASRTWGRGSGAFCWNDAGHAHTENATQIVLCKPLNSNIHRHIRYSVCSKRAVTADDLSWHITSGTLSTMTVYHDGVGTLVVIRSQVWIGGHVSCQQLLSKCPRQQQLQQQRKFITACACLHQKCKDNTVSTTISQCQTSWHETEITQIP